MRSDFLPLLCLVVTSATVAVAAPTPAAASNARSNFKGPIGLQLYSLRDQFAKDVPGTLDLVKSFGIKVVELAGTYGLTPEQFKALLDARGLKAVSGHFPYERYRNDVEGVAREAKALGLQYVGCAWIPHDEKVRFSEETCREAIGVFNRAGAALAKHNLKFFYHVHGYEFQPFKSGTLFDYMVAETDPRNVNFQMDVFWIVHPGQRPVFLLEKYGPRWQSLHLKGMRNGTPTGLLTGHSPTTNSVSLGTGAIDYPPILRAAQQAGVKWYFLEDEAPASDQQIPESLRYLLTVTF